MQTQRASIAQVGSTQGELKRVKQGFSVILEGAPVAVTLPKGEAGSHTSSIAEIPFFWA